MHPVVFEPLRGADLMPVRQRRPVEPALRHRPGIARPGQRRDIGAGGVARQPGLPGLAGPVRSIALHHRIDLIELAGQLMGGADADRQQRQRQIGVERIFRAHRLQRQQMRHIDIVGFGAFPGHPGDLHLPAAPDRQIPGELALEGLVAPGADVERGHLLPIVLRALALADADRDAILPHLALAVEPVDAHGKVQDHRRPDGIAGGDPHHRRLDRLRAVDDLASIIARHRPHQLDPVAILHHLLGIKRDRRIAGPALAQLGLHLVELRQRRVADADVGDGKRPVTPA